MDHSCLVSVGPFSPPGSVFTDQTRSGLLLFLFFKISKVHPTGPNVLLLSWKSSHWFVLPVSIAVKFPEIIYLLKKIISAHLSGNLLVLHFKICHIFFFFFDEFVTTFTLIVQVGRLWGVLELREFGSD